MSDEFTIALEEMLSRALPVIITAEKAAKRKHRTRQRPNGPLDEKEQRRKKMLRNMTPLTGQMTLFD